MIFKPLLLTTGAHEKDTHKKFMATKALFLKTIVSRFYVSSILFKCLRSNNSMFRSMKSHLIIWIYF